MKKFLILSILGLFVMAANAQLVTKSVTSSKTAAVTILYQNDKSNHPFGLQVVLDSAKMHANDTITTSFQVSNDGVHYVTYPSLTGGVLKKTVPAGVYTSTLNWKYFKVVLTPSSNDSTFTIYSYLLKN